MGRPDVIDDAHTDDRDPTFPQLALDASGNALLVWKGGTVPPAEDWSHQLLFQRYDVVEDRWSAAEVIDGWSDEPVYGSASWNALRMDGAGNAFAVWGGRGVSVSRWSAAAKACEAPVVLDGDRSARAPALAVDAAGNAVVAWMRGEATWAARYEAGAGWEAVVAIDAGSAGDPLLAMDEAGNALASWQSGAGLWVARFEPGSGWGGALDLENEGAANGGPRLAVERSGNAFVAWASAGEIWTRRYELDKGGGDATDVSVGARRPSEPPALAVDDAGNAFLVWTVVPAVGEEAIWANVYVAGGWGEATELEPNALGSLPLLAVHSGQVLALWSSDQGMAASRFANGDWSPRMQLKKAGKPAIADELHLTGLAGGFVAVWTIDESITLPNGFPIDVMSTYAAHYR